MQNAASIHVDADQQEAELADYLGAAYDRTKLIDHQREIDREFAAVGKDEATFYRSSAAYLYDLTVFAMSGTKLPYLETLTDLVRPGSRLLDYGCGIGADGLALIDAGYQVEFADFDNPSTAYLRWRLERRGISAPIHDLDRGVPGGFDAVYSFDVIEHVADPLAFLTELERRADLVMVNLLEFDPNEQELHYRLPLTELFRHVAERELMHYSVHHGSSHLVAYRPSKVGALRAMVQRQRMAATRRRARD